MLRGKNVLRITILLCEFDVKSLMEVFIFLVIGPDICGPGTKKVHVIFNYKGKNLLTKKDIRCKVNVN